MWNRTHHVITFQLSQAMQLFETRRSYLLALHACNLSIFTMILIWLLNILSPFIYTVVPLMMWKRMHWIDKTIKCGMVKLQYFVRDNTVSHMCWMTLLFAWSAAHSLHVHSCSLLYFKQWFNMVANCSVTVHARYIDVDGPFTMYMYARCWCDTDALDWQNNQMGVVKLQYAVRDNSFSHMCWLTFLFAWCAAHSLHVHSCSLLYFNNDLIWLLTAVWLCMLDILMLMAPSQFICTLGADVIRMHWIDKTIKWGVVIAD